MKYTIETIQIENGVNVLDAINELAKSAAQCHEVDTANNPDEYVVDDVSGAELDPKIVKQARMDEIEYVRTMKLYTKVPISECRQKTWKDPIAVRWIDVNKQDSATPLYRSRLVG